MNNWDQIRDYLRDRVSVDGYDNWLKGTAFAGLDGETLYVSVPDRETRSWLETEYTQLIHAAIHTLGLPVRQVAFETEAKKGGLPPAPTVNGHEAEATATALNPKFTFGSFVV